MKKNVMMRIAACLLVCVLASTCGISGTFAKYVTSDYAEDTARIAQWGVNVIVDGTLFSDKYVNEENGNIPGTVNLTVTSSDGDKLVAPGTQNDEGMSFKLTGTPEVSVNVEFKFEVVSGSEPFLAKDTSFDNPTTGAVGDNFTVPSDYYPVVFTLKKDGTQVAQGNVAAIQTYLTNELNGTYEPNEDLSDLDIAGEGEYTLTWAWAFNNGRDVEDTYLGNLAAGSDQEFTVKFTITVTQVD